MSKQDNLGVCRFCGYTHPLVESHIIPKGFHQTPLSDDRPIQLVSSFSGEYQARKRTGIYDRFLCKKHEGLFGKWDDYAIKLLRDSTPTPVNAEMLLFKSVNYTLLKLFFISLLWRANETGVPFYQNVDLGAHSDILKSHIEQSNPGGIDDYSVMLTHSSEDIAGSVAAPRKEHYLGIDFILFDLPHYLAVIKVDEKPLPPKLHGQALNDSGKLYVERRTVKGTKEERIMNKAVWANKLRKESDYDPDNII